MSADRALALHHHGLSAKKHNNSSPFPPVTGRHESWDYRHWSFPFIPFCLDKDRQSSPAWVLGNKSPPTHLLLGPRERGKLPGATPSPVRGKLDAGEQAWNKPCLRLWAEPRAGKAGNREEAFHALSWVTEVYKIKARQSEPHRAEARGIRTSGQVRASGCGLEPGTKIKSKIGIQQCNSSHPLPAMCWESSSSGDQEALRLLSSCQVPDDKKDTGNQIILCCWSLLQAWDGSNRSWSGQDLAPFREQQVAIKVWNKSEIFHTTWGFSHPPTL